LNSCPNDTYSHSIVGRAFEQSPCRVECDCLRNSQCKCRQRLFLFLLTCRFIGAAARVGVEHRIWVDGGSGQLRERLLLAHRRRSVADSTASAVEGRADDICSPRAFQLMDPKQTCRSVSKISRGRLAHRTIARSIASCRNAQGGGRVWQVREAAARSSLFLLRFCGLARRGSDRRCCTHRPTRLGTGSIDRI